jgi:hypothetical protein
VFAVLVFGVPRVARADWLFAGYMGASGTSSNTLTVTPAFAPSFSINDVAYKGQAFRSPWYYGVPRGWLPAATKGVGAEIEWTHAKAIAQIDPRASDLNAFQQSHGLNFCSATSPTASPAAAGVARGRPRRRGHLDPHVESTFRNVHQEQYQRGGFAWQLGAGLEFHLWQFVYGVAMRASRASPKTPARRRGRIAGSFFTRHVDFGVALRLPEPLTATAAPSARSRSRWLRPWSARVRRPRSPSRRSSRAFRRISRTSSRRQRHHRGYRAAPAAWRFIRRTTRLRRDLPAVRGRRDFFRAGATHRRRRRAERLRARHLRRRPRLASSRRHGTRSGSRSMRRSSTAC